VRLFAAIAVPAEVAAALGEVIRPLPAMAPAGLRWTSPDDWHLTLAFYRQVPDDRVPDLQVRLARAVARRTAPTLAVGPLGTFGPTRAARVLWVGLEGDLHLLRSLAASARAAGRRVGLDGADLAPRRPFRPHLTLARARSGADLRGVLAAATARPGLPGLGWQADEAVLVRSDLGQGPGGAARHTVLARLPFSRRGWAGEAERSTHAGPR
jgi:2'-5' RNA ligase